MSKFLLIILLFSKVCFSQSVKSLIDIVGQEASITEIDLSNSGLEIFPIEILKCKNLKVLNLSNNGLTDLPVELSKLESLTILNLSGNEGLDSEDLSKVFSESTFFLKELNLSGCDLIFLPAEIGKQNKLENLDLSNNNLTALPYGFISLNHIKTANLSNNYFYDLSGVLKYWWFLESVNLSDNKTYLSGATLMELSYASNLKKVELDNLISFPKDTPINVKELCLRNSYISNFQVSESPIKINKLVFDNCNFDADNYSKEAVISQRFDHITFENIDVKYLEKMQFLKADSLSFKNCSLKKEMFDIIDQSVKHIDLRSINFSTSDMEHIQKANPSVNFYFKEMVEEMPKINPPFKNLVQAAEVKSVQSEKESTIVFKDVAVMIPANAFKTVAGSQYNGAVNISVKSYMNPMEIMLSGIPMTINGGGESMMFSSGGMIDIQGEGANGEQLELQKPLDIAISSPSSDPNMSLFALGNSSGADFWEEDGEDELIEPFKLDQRLVDSVANQDFDKMIVKSVVDLQPRLVPFFTSARENDRDGFTIGFNELATSKPSELDDKYNYLQYESNAISYLKKYNLQYYGDSAKYYKRLVKAIADSSRRAYRKLYNPNDKTYSYRGANFVQDFTLLPNLEKDVFELSFRFKGKLIVLPVVLANKSGNLKREIKLNSKFYKGYKKEIFKAKLKYDHAIKKLVARNRSEVRSRELDREKARQKLLYDKTRLLRENAAFMAAKATSSSVFRAFEISSFGIFNCDVRGRMKTPKAVSRLFKNIKSRLVIVADYDKNGVIQFKDIASAFFDAAAKTTIIVFLSKNNLGIIKWNKGKASEMKTLSIEDLANPELLDNLMK